MEANVKTDVKLTISREALLASLNEVNQFLPSTKMINGSEIIAIAALEEEKKIVISGMGVDEGLVMKTVKCDTIEGSAIMYLNGTVLYSRLSAMKKEKMDMNFIAQKRTTIIKCGKSKVSINTSSEVDFAEDGSIVENKESVYAVGETPIRIILGKEDKNIGEYGSFKLPLKKLLEGLKSGIASPYENSEVSLKCIKLSLTTANSKLSIAGSNGYSIGLTEIENCVVENPKGLDEMAFVLREEMVLKLIKTMTKVLGNSQKGNKPDCMVKISLGKSMMSFEMDDVAISTQKYDMECVDVRRFFEFETIWHGFVDVSDFKSLIQLAMSVDSSGKQDAFVVDVENKKIKTTFVSDVGEIMEDYIDYSFLEEAGEPKLNNDKIKVSFKRLSMALNLIKDKEAFIRIHKITGNNIIISFVNADNHEEYGFTHGIAVME